MEHQVSQESGPSRDSSISLEDGPFPSYSRSELYTSRQRPREAYGPVTSEPFFMASLDLPCTHAAEVSSAGTQLPDDVVESPSLSVLRMERYLAEEHYHERFSLGIHPLGANRATVNSYLPEIIQTMVSDASQAEATRGTVTDCDDKGSQGSTAPWTSTASEASPESIRTHDNNDTATALLPPASLSIDYMAPSLAGLNQTEAALAKPKHTADSSESHLEASDIYEEDFEAGRILMMRQRKRGGIRQEGNRWRVGKPARVRRSVRMRKRPDELK